mmetsp:Transcript_20883/g.53522  ORF Transcript_20883/g.53522 Transcript_20883/m.53522 type:complete len:238 (+) Transcript_20883:85-798(+)
MSCSHGGSDASGSFIRSRMLSSTALKLFSFGLRRMRRLKVLYTSSPPAMTCLLVSAWYCAVSSATVSVRRKPRGGRFWSILTRPVKSFMSLPSSSFTSITSHPRQYTRPKRSMGLGSRPSTCMAAASWSVGGRMVSRKSTSCSFSSSHSERTSPRRNLVLITTSAVTAAGLFWPTSGFFTSTMAKLCSGIAMRDHPVKWTLISSSSRRALTRARTSLRSSLISYVASRRNRLKLRSR